MFEVLNLASATSGGAYSFDFSCLSSLAKLRILNASGTDVSSTSIVHLTALEHLIDIDVSQNSIVERGYNQLLNMKNLKKIQVSMNRYLSLDQLKKLQESGKEIVVRTDSSREHTREMDLEGLGSVHLIKI